MDVHLAPFWQKKFFPAGTGTFVVELDSEELRVFYAGSIMADSKMQIQRAGAVGQLGQYSVNRAVGQAVADAMIAGYTKKLDEKLKAYNESGSEALLGHAKNKVFLRSDISDVTVLDRPAMMDPAAAKNLSKESGLIEFVASGKKYRMILRYLNREGTELFAEMLRGNVAV